MAADRSIPTSGPKTGAEVTTDILEELTQLYKIAPMTVESVGGDGDGITGGVTPALSAYADQQTFIVRIGSANTVVAPTLNVDSIGAVTIVGNDGGALVAGELVAGTAVLLQYETSPSARLRILANLGYVMQTMAALGDTLVFQDGWDASAGSFPGGGAAQKGSYWIVTTAGTVDSVDFALRDRVVAITDSASDTTYAANWQIIDYSDLAASDVGNDSGVSGATVADALDALEAVGVTAASGFGTDNRLLRSDGTGRGAQASAIAVDDSGNMSGVGTLTTSGNISASGTGIKSLQVISSDDHCEMDVRGATGKTRYQKYRTGSLVRWVWGTTAATESGSNVGSNQTLQNYNDGGTYIGDAINVTRSNGAIAFPQVGTTGSGANAFLDSGASNNLLRSTSSLRFKEDVEHVDADRADAFLAAARPIWHRSLAPADVLDDGVKKSFYSFGAEDLAAIDPRLTTWGYDADDYEIVQVDETTYRELERIDDVETLVDTGETDGAGSPVMKTVTLAQPVYRDVIEPVMETRLKDGAVRKPDGINDRAVIAMLTSVVQRQAARLDALEAAMARR